MEQTALKNSKPSVYEDTLRISTALFARNGYEGVSMRTIADAVGVKAAALYYHFPDKQRLYLAVMAYALSNKLPQSAAALNADAPPLERLDRFVACMVDELTRDPDLLLLLQRERLDGNEERRSLMVREVFASHYRRLAELVRELAPHQNPTMLALSITGLIMFHLETASLSRFLPGWQPEDNCSEHLVAHIRSLLRAILTSRQKGGKTLRV